MRMLTEELMTRRRWLQEIEQRNHTGGQKFSPQSLIDFSMKNSCMFNKILKKNAGLNVLQLPWNIWNTFLAILSMNNVSMEWKSISINYYY